MSVFTNLESDSQLFKTDSDAVKPKSVFMFFWKKIVTYFGRENDAENLLPVSDIR